jgi:hypothetical protein
VTSLDKLEIKMLRLLRSKNINRFRPQNQQAMGFTRLIDVRDAELHWNFLEQGMNAIRTGCLQIKYVHWNLHFIYFRCLATVKADLSSAASSIAGDISIADTLENIDDSQESSTTMTSKGEKRIIDEPLDDEDMPVLERLNKRLRCTEIVECKSSAETSSISSPSIDNKSIQSKCLNQEQAIKSSSKRFNKKRTTPSNRSKRQTRAAWMKKYDIEDCCIHLEPYDHNRLDNDDEWHVFLVFLLLLFLSLCG